MQSDTRQQVAATVRAELARRRLRQADAAAATGLSQPAMSRRLTGEVAFDVDELQTLADFIGVELHTLIARDEPVAS